MRNLLITIAFCGARYHGFQVQKNALSVCEVFQDAVERVLHARPDVKGCSRTDAGVHANEYCLSMPVESAIPCDKLQLALNSHLPPDIAVHGVCEVPSDFHARYSCNGKQYLYRLLNSRVHDPFAPHLSYRWGFPLDAALLHREAQAFVGEHDFAAFQSAGSDIADTVRTVHACSVERCGSYVLFTVEGDGFLYNMVRIMVGTLVFIAAGRLEPGCIPRILASRDRAQAGKTMPAKGLFLNRVFYPTHYRSVTGESNGQSDCKTTE